MRTNLTHHLLAAIQGLNQKLEETRAENAELRKALQEINHENQTPRANRDHLVLPREWPRMKGSTEVQAGIEEALQVLADTVERVKLETEHGT